MAYHSKLFKIKEGKQAQWENWCKTLSTDKKLEAMETLKQEQVKREIFLVFPNYTVGIMEGENILPSDPNGLLNQEHKRQMSECLEAISKGTVGYDLMVE